MSHFWGPLHLQLQARRAAILISQNCMACLESLEDTNVACNFSGCLGMLLCEAALTDNSLIPQASRPLASFWRFGKNERHEVCDPSFKAPHPCEPGSATGKALFCSDARMKKPGTLCVRASHTFVTIPICLSEMFPKVKRFLFSMFYDSACFTTELILV